MGVWRSPEHLGDEETRYSLKEAQSQRCRWHHGDPSWALGPCQAAGLAQQKPCEFQQGQMQSSTLGQEQNLATGWELTC